MPNYTITIKNQSHQSQSFVLFQDLPKPANIPMDNVFTNVYQQAARIPGNGEAMFEVSSDLFALFGSSNRTDEGMIKVETSYHKRANLGPGGSKFYLTAEEGVYPRFGREDHSAMGSGGFVIGTDNTFSPMCPENIYFGVGAMAPDSGEVVPVQTYPAQPGLVAEVYSKPKYYVAFGNYQPGSIVDPMMLGNVLSIDFDGSNGHEAIFTLNHRNDYVADHNVHGSGIYWRVGQQS